MSVEILSRSVGHGGPWTYVDPYGDLAHGDVVRVPFGSQDRLFVGRIVAENAEPPRGLTIKTVAQRARFE